MLDVNLVKTLGSVEISATFKLEGMVLGIYGASGAGKTSILNMLAGLIRPMSGHIKLGSNILFDSDNNIYVAPHKRRIGYVFQEARLFSHLTMIQNLCYGCKDNRTNMNTLAATLDILPLFEKKVRDLSGGEKQCVAIGRALLSNPQLLLFDEPLNSLDQKRKNRVLDYLLHIKTSTKIPMIYVSHVLDEIRAISDSVMEIREGKILLR